MDVWWGFRKENLEKLLRTLQKEHLYKLLDKQQIEFLKVDPESVEQIGGNIFKNLEELLTELLKNYRRNSCRNSRVN